MGTQRLSYEPTHFVNVKMEIQSPFIYLLNIYRELPCATVLADPSVLVLLDSTSMLLPLLS